MRRKSPYESSSGQVEIGVPHPGKCMVCGAPISTCPLDDSYGLLLRIYRLLSVLLAYLLATGRALAALCRESLVAALAPLGASDCCGHCLRVLHVATLP